MLLASVLFLILLVLVRSCCSSRGKEAGGRGSRAGSREARRGGGKKVKEQESEQEQECYVPQPPPCPPPRDAMSWQSLQPLAPAPGPLAPAPGLLAPDPLEEQDVPYAQYRQAVSRNSIYV